MDFLLIVLGIGGLVFAGVMLVLASRASRMQLESDARVEELHTLAVGSVLFAHDESVESPAGATQLRDDRPQPVHDLTFDAPLQAYPFVMTVPARASRGPASFDRSPRRSQS
jgi:hypothetical protein